jgi:hypothetical protein
MDQEPVVVVVAAKPADSPPEPEKPSSSEPEAVVAAAAAASAAASADVGMELGKITSVLVALQTQQAATQECVTRIESQIGPMQQVMDELGQMVIEAEVETLPENPAPAPANPAPANPEPAKPAKVEEITPQPEVKPNPAPAPKAQRGPIMRFLLGG